MKNLFLLLAALFALSTAQAANKEVPIHGSGLEIDEVGPNQPILEICLNGVVYYMISVHSGYSLAPKFLPGKATPEVCTK